MIRLIVVETRNSDPLQEHRMELGIEARTPDQPGEHSGRICTVPSHFPADDPNQRLGRVDRTHDEHVAPMSLAERGVIEADDMGEKPCQGTTPLSREVQTTFRSRKRSHPPTSSQTSRSDGTKIIVPYAHILTDRQAE
jgi:hypothetical protein